MAMFPRGNSGIGAQLSARHEKTSLQRWIDEDFRFGKHGFAARLPDIATSPRRFLQQGLQVPAGHGKNTASVAATSAAEAIETTLL
jgi:hypothetical protein